ncbi:hypothetical protein [Rhizobium sp.]
MIVGRVDEMMNGKVYGWAFNSDVPSERLEVRISRGAEVVATGTADVFRKDLPDAGVGDGSHAFNIEVPPNISSFQGLVIVARSATSGEAVLPIATNDDRRVDDLFHVFSQRYDDLMVEMKAELEEIKVSSGTVATALGPELEDRLARVERRLEDFEVFVIRLDEMTRTLQERVGLLRPKGFFAWFRRR